MNYRTLGRTGLRVSEIGLGAWGLGGGDQWRDSDDAESRKALRRAFELGVNFYDTALAYNDGHSESLVGELSRLVGRDKIVIASKIPPLNREWPARCGVPSKDVFPPKYVRRSTESSLKNLQTDYIDIHQLHVWQDHWLEQSDWLEELQKLKKEGKIRFIGVSINDHDPESAMLLPQSRAADVVQVIYNIFDQSPENALFDLCKQDNVGIIVRCPFDEGGLSGTMTAATRFPEGDFRADYFKGNRPAEVETRVKRLERFVGPETKSIAELALRFCLANDAVSTVIPGMRKASHVEANALASDDRKLSASTLADLRAHAWPRNFYS